jgi:magnesium transporter
MIRLYLWDPETKTGICPILPQLPVSAASVSGEAIVWVDLENPTPDEEAKVFGEFLSVHPLALEDITRQRRRPNEGAHLPKVEEFDSYLLTIVNPLPWEVMDPSKATITTELPIKRRLKTTWIRPQLSAILTHNVLITHHYEALPCIDAVRNHVARRADTTRRGPDYLFHLVLDEMVDEYAPVVERFAKSLDGMETEMFEHPTPKVLSKLLRLKRRVIFLRKTLILEREVLARLVRGEFELVREEEMVYYRNVYDHLVRYTELIEAAREMVSDLTQTYLAAASNRTNEIMKVLTIISTSILPMTLIAGIYGMNFENLPETKWHYGYYLALGLMAIVGSAPLVLFRWRRWL